MRHFIIAAALAGTAILLPHAARAASFDCRKAAKPAEKTICDDKALSDADDTLARDYTRLMGVLLPAQKQALQKSQRSWIAYAPLACSSDGRGTIKDRAQFAQCLKSEYDQRLAMLARQPQSVGPFKVLELGEFQAMPSSSTDPDFFPVVTHVKTVAALYEGDETRAALLNGWLQSLASNDKAGWDDNETSASLTVSLASANGSVATASVTSEMFGVGAAHPLTVFSSPHLVLATGKPLLFRDMFQANARAALIDRAWSALRKKLGNDMMVEKKADLAKPVTDPAHWTFGPDGLTINFNVYEVAAYVMGPQDIVLPWSALHDLLTPLGQSIADAAR